MYIKNIREEKEDKMKIRNRQTKFMLMLLFFSAIIFFYSYNGRVAVYQTTLYAFSYKYGFISRAFIGTLYQGIGKIFSVNMLNYQMALFYTQVITALFFVLMFGFFWFLIQKMDEDTWKHGELVIILYTLLTVSMFSCSKNFGRVDIYLVALSFVAVMLLCTNKHLWLLVPIVAVCVMIHQGYVFMYFNIILVLLIYRFFTEKKENRLRNGALFFCVFFVGSSLFLYFEFFSRTNGMEIVDEIIRNASAVSYQGSYHETLIDHEILNVDLSDVEWDFHKENFVQLPFFALMTAPFIWLLIQFAKNVFSRCHLLEEKIKYFFVCFGFLTLLPNYILKVDYARWTYAMFSYFSIMVLALIVLKDEIVIESIEEVANMRKKHPGMILLIPYLTIFVPLWDVYFNQASKHFSDWLNVYVHFM